MACHPPYDCELLGKVVGPVQTSTGVALMAERSYGRVGDGIDTLIVPGAARKSVAVARRDSIDCNLKAPGTQGPTTSIGLYRNVLIG